MPIVPGEFVAGKYRVEKIIGKGGMGVVVAAHDVALDRPVAIKFLSGAASPEFSARFRREARAMAKVTNEHVVRVLDVGERATGDPYMVMERLEGTDLSALVQKRGRLPLQEVADYVLQACEAIAEAHALGIVHRDLKPSNMYLARRSDGTTAIKLLDFGIAKMPSEDAADPLQSLTTTTALLGSPAYMSPEQLLCARNVDARSDIWSLGAILHTLLAGRPPFVGETMPQVCALIVTGQPARVVEVRPDVPGELQDVILRCLEKRAEDRFQSVAELARALTPFSPPWALLSAERAASMMRKTGDVDLAPALDVEHPRNETSTSYRRARPERTGTPLAAARSQIEDGVLPAARPPASKRLAIAAGAAALGVVVLSALLAVRSSRPASHSGLAAASQSGASALPASAPFPPPALERASPADGSSAADHGSAADHLSPGNRGAAAALDRSANGAPSSLATASPAPPAIAVRTPPPATPPVRRAPPPGGGGLAPSSPAGPGRAPTVDNREFGGRK
jgi:serine/threonine-protein kinase